MFSPTEFPCVAWAVSAGLNARSATLVNVLRESEYPNYLPTDFGPVAQDDIFETVGEAGAEILARVVTFDKLKAAAK